MTMISRVVVWVACWGLACVSCGGDDDAPESAGLHACAVTGSLGGGLEHEFGGPLDCAGAKNGTTLFDYQSEKREWDEGFVALSVEFQDAVPVEGQTWPVAAIRVGALQQLPSGAQAKGESSTYNWSFPEGACSLVVNSTSRDPAKSYRLWFNATGTCSEPSMSSIGGKKEPLTLATFELNSFVEPAAK